MEISHHTMSQDDDAGSMTQSLLMEMDRFIAGDAERALIAGNSMIAAARLLLRRFDVDEQQRKALFEEYWKPLLAEEAA